MQSNLPQAKESYSPQSMVEVMVQHPEYSHAQLAAHFGRAPSWLSSVLASNSFQQALDLRRGEVLDPSLNATMDERFRTLAIRSVLAIGQKLESPEASDLLVLKAADLGIKALGMGNPQALPTPVVTVVSGADAVADRILNAMRRQQLKNSSEGSEDAEVINDGG